MRWLIRLYPEAWRLRYGEEFEGLLEQRQLSPIDVFDVVMGAIEAHLRPQVSAERVIPDGRQLMKPHQWAGLAGAVGGSLLAVKMLDEVNSGPPYRWDTSWLLFMALLGLYLRVRGQLDGLGRAGLAIGFAGLAVALAGTYVQYFFIDVFWPAAELGFLLALYGVIVAGAAVARARLLGRLSFTLLVVGVLGSAAWAVGAPDASGPLVTLGSVALWTLYTLSWALLGYAICSGTKATPIRVRLVVSREE